MKTIIYTALLGILFLGCDRATNVEVLADNTLPPITQSGANTFGCKINGVVMIPRNSIGYLPPGSNHYPCDYLRGTNYEYEHLSAADLRTETKRGIVYLYFQNDINNGNPTFVGSHPIFDGKIPSELNDYYKDYIYITAYDASGNSHPYVSIENSGSIEVLKSDSKILSGTFSCKAKNINNPNDIITITDGRFDIDKTTINSTNFP